MTSYKFLNGASWMCKGKPCRAEKGAVVDDLPESSARAFLEMRVVSVVDQLPIRPKVMADDIHIDLESEKE